MIFRVTWATAGHLQHGRKEARVAWGGHGMGITLGTMESFKPDLIPILIQLSCYYDAM